MGCAVYYCNGIYQLYLCAYRIRLRQKIDFSKLKSFAYYEKGIEHLELNNLDKPKMLDALETALIKRL